MEVVTTTAVFEVKTQAGQTGKRLPLPRRREAHKFPPPFYFHFYPIRA